MTEEGTILGTFPYMSPEQIEGKELDGRSDIFSFGTVLYEMVTGWRAFEGKSQVSVASAILEREPAPIPSVKPMTPPALDHAIRRCLAKDRDERWQTAKDLGLELKWIAESALHGALSWGTPTGDTRERTTRALWGTAAVLLLAVAGIAGWVMKPAPPQPVSRAVITLPPGQRLTALDEPAIALSDDGTQLAYVALHGDTQQIYLRAMDNPQPRAVPGAEGGTGPFFSPDGQWLGFFADQKLKKVSLGGGPVVTLGDATTPQGGSWSSQGTIVFASLLNGPLRQTTEAGATPQPLTHFEKGENTHRAPQFLPGGKSLLFVSGTSSFNWGADTQVVVQSIETTERRNLIKGGVFPRYASSGHLLYAQEGSVFAAPFDAQRFVITGPATPLGEGVLQSRTTGAAQYAISGAGSLVYISGGMQNDHRRLA